MTEDRACPQELDHLRTNESPYSWVPVIGVLRVSTTSHYRVCSVLSLFFEENQVGDDDIVTLDMDSLR